jgi:hypothetical protein
LSARKRAGEWEVVYAHQSRGFSLEARRGVVSKTEDGYALRGAK